MRIRILFLTLLIVNAVQVMAGGISHPAMLHSQADILRVRSSLSISPVKEAWQHLRNSSYAQQSYTEHTSALADGYLKRLDYNNWGPQGAYGQYQDYANYSSAMRDAHAAYQLALRYQLSADSRYAEAAVKILNAWAANCKGIMQTEGWTNKICDPNLYLINIQAYQFANAAELLRDYSGWNAEDFTKFQGWMRSTFYSIAHLFLENHHGNSGNMHYWLNWDLANLTAVLSIGILCDDQTLIDYAVNYYKTQTTEAAYVRNAVPYLHQDPDSDEVLGQCQESGRDQGHATLCVSLLGAFCQMALNVGEDLFAYDDYRAVKMAEYVAKYNLPTAETYSSSDKQFVYDDTPYTPYSNPSYSNPVLQADGRGTLRPCWELFAAYARSHDVKARYCEAWVELMRTKSGFGSDGGAGDYGTGSGGFDQLGYGTLMYSTVGAVDTGDKSSAMLPVFDNTCRTASSNKYGSSTTMEVKNNSDFVGVLKFQLPAEALTADYVIYKATLRLVSERVKGERTMEIYPFFEDFNESDGMGANNASNTTRQKYEAAIIAAREAGVITTFQAKGSSKALESNDVIPDDYLSIEAWTNEIDLTAYVKGLASPVFSIMIAAASTTDAKKFFTKEAKSIEKVGFAAADLVPLLTIVYRKAETTVMNAPYTTRQTSYTMHHCYDLGGRRVAQPTKGLYIVNGKKMVVK